MWTLPQQCRYINMPDVTIKLGPELSSAHVAGQHIVQKLHGGFATADGPRTVKRMMQVLCNSNCRRTGL